MSTGETHLAERLEVRSAAAMTLPARRLSISIRHAEQSDLAFIDELQKMHTKMIGWFSTQQLEANIKR